MRVGAIGVLAAAALLAAGCGGTAAPPPTTGPAKPIVALVADAAGIGDHGFDELAYLGLLHAETALGIDGRLYQSVTARDYFPNLVHAAKQHPALVIAIGSAEAAAVARAARWFPKTRFAIVDVSAADIAGTPRNVEGIVFAEQQAAYLAGYLATLVAEQHGGHGTLGSVGEAKQPDVEAYVAGFQAGAKAADPKVVLLNDYAADCRTAALRQIAAGASIVLQAGRGCASGVLDAARERDVWAIPSDADGSDLLGSHVLTSVVERVDSAVYGVVQQTLAHSFAGRSDLRFDLSDHGVGLGRVSAKVPARLVREVAAVRRRIVDGAIADIPTTGG